MLKKFSTILLMIIISTALTSCYTESSLECSYQLKQIEMCDAENGWALTMENEILFTENGVKNFKPIKQVTDINKYTDDFMSAVFPDNKTAYVTYFASDDDHLVVEYTRNSGASWEQTFIKYRDYAEICDAGSAFISFGDDGKGYLLYCSTPAAGQMTKLLFYTEDAGESYLFVKDLTNEIAGYPQGVTFASGEVGYIAATYHGDDNYLYMTLDGAKTWQSVEVFDKSESVSYIDSFPVVFSAKNKQKGMLVLKEAAGENIMYKLFLTNDMGRNWISNGEISCDSLIDYSFASDNQFYVIDHLGKLYIKKSDAISEMLDD